MQGKLTKILFHIEIKKYLYLQLRDIWSYYLTYLLIDLEESLKSITLNLAPVSKFRGLLNAYTIVFHTNELVDFTFALLHLNVII